MQGGVDISSLAGKRKVEALMDMAAGRPGSSDDGQRALPRPTPTGAPIALGNAPTGPSGPTDATPDAQKDDFDDN